MRMLHIEEVATVLGCSPFTIRRMMKAGTFPAYVTVGVSKRWSVSTIRAFAEGKWRPEINALVLAEERAAKQVKKHKHEQKRELLKQTRMQKRTQKQEREQAQKLAMKPRPNELTTTQLGHLLNRSSASLKTIRAAFPDFPRHTRRVGISLFYDAATVREWMVKHDGETPLKNGKKIDLKIFDQRLAEITESAS